MEESFDKLIKIAKDFYLGWKWSTEHQYTKREYESFVNQVEEPLNCEVARLYKNGFTMDEINRVMNRVKEQIWSETIQQDE